MEIFFSLLILFITYFLAGLGLVQGYIPGAAKEIAKSQGQKKELFVAKRVIIISFLLAMFATSMLVYFFIFPNYSYA